MPGRRLVGAAWLLIVVMLVSAGCGRMGERQSEAPAAPATAEGATAGGAGDDTGTAPVGAVPTGAAATAEVVSSSGEAAPTPPAAAPGSAQEQGQSAPGPGAGVPGPADVEDQGAQPEGGAMVTYTDSSFKFRLEHPANFIARPSPAEALGRLEPRPVAGLAFLSPQRATSDLGAMELADLEVRVHEAGGAPSLDAWLAANNLQPTAGAPPLEPYQSAGASGVKRCGATMLFPGCAYFFLGEGLVYQLIPASQEGEAMLKTFTPL